MRAIASRHQLRNTSDLHGQELLPQAVLPMPLHSTNISRPPTPTEQEHSQRVLAAAEHLRRLSQPIAATSNEVHVASFPEQTASQYLVVSPPPKQQPFGIITYNAISRAGLADHTRLADATVDESNDVSDSPTGLALQRSLRFADIAHSDTQLLREVETFESLVDSSLGMFPSPPTPCTQGKPATQFAEDLYKPLEWIGDGCKEAFVPHVAKPDATPLLPINEPEVEADSPSLDLDIDLRAWQSSVGPASQPTTKQTRSCLSCSRSMKAAVKKETGAGCVVS